MTRTTTTRSLGCRWRAASSRSCRRPRGGSRGGCPSSSAVFRKAAPSGKRFVKAHLRISPSAVSILSLGCYNSFCAIKSKWRLTSYSVQRFNHNKGLVEIGHTFIRYDFTTSILNVCVMYTRIHVQVLDEFPAAFTTRNWLVNRLFFNKDWNYKCHIELIVIYSCD